MYGVGGIDEEELLTEAMVKVPKQYKAVIASEIRKNGAGLTLDDIQEAMNTLYGIKINNSHGGRSDDDNGETALNAVGKITCYKCGKIGHKAYQCRLKGT